MVRSNTTQKDRVFKDPDVNQAGRFRVVAVRILLIVIAGVSAVCIIGLISLNIPTSAIEGNITTISKIPDYISVEYNANKFDVNYTRITSNTVVVGIDAVQNSYVVPLRVYEARFIPPFDVAIDDRDWGVMYLVSVEETVGNESFTYYWTISKTAIGYTTVKNL
jgi:hypothetical protein